MGSIWGETPTVFLMLRLIATLEQPFSRTAPMSRKPVPTLYVAMTLVGSHGKQ